MLDLEKTTLPLPVMLLITFLLIHMSQKYESHSAQLLTSHHFSGKVQNQNAADISDESKSTDFVICHFCRVSKEAAPHSWH